MISEFEKSLVNKIKADVNRLSDEGRAEIAAEIDVAKVHWGLAAFLIILGMIIHWAIWG